MKVKMALIWVTLLTTVSNLLGFMRESGVAYVFGASFVTDAYYLSAILPDALSVWVAGGLTAAVLPRYKEYQMDGEEERLFAHSLLAVVTLSMAAVTLVTVLAAPYILRMMAPGFSEEGISLATQLFYYTSPAILFTGVLGAVTAFLNAHHRFLSSASVGIVQNVIILTGIVVVSGTKNIYHLAFFFTLSMAARLFIQLPSLRSIGILQGPWKVQWNHPGLRRLGRTMGPVMIGTLASNVSFIIDRILASGLAAGNISALNYAHKVVGIPQQMFAISLATVLFPRLSEAMAKKNEPYFLEQLYKGLGFLTYVMVPVSIYLCVFREGIIRLLFERGAFLAEDTHRTADLLGVFSFGLVFISLAVLLIRAFYARQETRIPLVVGFTAVLTNAAAGLVLVRYYDALGIAASNVISFVVYVGLLWGILLRRMDRSENVRVLRSELALGSTLAGGGLVCAFALGASHLMPAPHTAWALCGWLALMGVLGGAVYLGLTYAFGSPFARQAVQAPLRKFGK